MITANPLIQDDLNPQTVDVISAKFIDAQTPGFAPEFTLDEAEEAGAFSEDALSEMDAKESSEELL